METKSKAIHTLIVAIKIAIGSCASIYIAEQLGLEFAASAGIITLLSIVSTKWETLKLSLSRIVTFFMSVLVSGVIFTIFPREWVAFGLYIFCVVLVSEWVGWRATVSVNAVVGTHFMQTHDFSVSAVMNEFWLVVIGIVIAIIFNLFQINTTQKKQIIVNMRYTENELQKSLGRLSRYLLNEPIGEHVWDEIIALENKLEWFEQLAYSYQGNTFVSHPSYYINYFEMRSKQCSILHNLHYEMKKIRELPKQATIIAEYVDYLQHYVIEVNNPKEQIKRLELLLSDLKAQELPKTREEFESRAMLYHILMDLEDFLLLKKRFMESVDEEQQRVYWRGIVE